MDRIWSAKSSFINCNFCFLVFCLIWCYVLWWIVIVIDKSILFSCSISFFLVAFYSLPCDQITFHHSCAPSHCALFLNNFSTLNIHACSDVGLSTNFCFPSTLSSHARLRVHALVDRWTRQFSSLARVKRSIEWHTWTRFYEASIDWHLRDTTFFTENIVDVDRRLRWKTLKFNANTASYVVLGKFTTNIICINLFSSLKKGNSFECRKNLQIMNTYINDHFQKKKQGNVINYDY